MRRFLATVLAIALAGVGGCSAKVGGEKTKSRAEGLGFEVVETHDTSVVVKIGKRCTADMTLPFVDSELLVGKIYDQNGSVIRNDRSDKATSPEQYMGDLKIAAACY